MALIKCSECNKEVSDKAPACIHCGNPMEHLPDIRKSPETSTTSNDTNCPKCGKGLDDSGLCYFCGYNESINVMKNNFLNYSHPKESFKEKIQSVISANKSRIIFISIVAVILIVIVIAYSSNGEKSNTSDSYDYSRETCAYTSAFGSCNFYPVDGDIYCHDHTSEICLTSYCDKRVASNGVFCSSHYKMCYNTFCTRPATHGSYCSYHSTDSN